MANAYIDEDKLREVIVSLSGARRGVVLETDRFCQRFRNNTWDDNLARQTAEKVNRFLSVVNNILSILEQSERELKRYEEALKEYFRCVRVILDSDW